MDNFISLPCFLHTLLIFLHWFSSNYKGIQICLHIKNINKGSTISRWSFILPCSSLWWLCWPISTASVMQHQNDEWNVKLEFVWKSATMAVQEGDVLLMVVDMFVKKTSDSLGWNEKSTISVESQEQLLNFCCNLYFYLKNSTIKWHTIGIKYPLNKTRFKTKSPCSPLLLGSFPYLLRTMWSVAW